tara:strand:- start:13130 stop:13921 length:792 start_codon:yes stop_codon:yes gene_type:complete
MIFIKSLLQMNQRDILIVIILLIVIALIICYFLKKNGCSDLECKGDKDCLSGVCSKGKCVQCAFDSDCCASSTCQNNVCVPITNEEVDCGLPPVFDYACSNVNFDPLNPPGQETFDLKPIVTEGDSLIDWSTLTFTTIEVYSRDSSAQSPQFTQCNNDDLDLLPYGTHEQGSIVPGNDFCGPAVEGPPGTFTWQECNNGTQTQTGNTDTAVVSHDSDGVIAVDYSTTGIQFSAGLYWRFNYNVQTENGCSYDNIAYFAMGLDL